MFAHHVNILCTIEALHLAQGGIFDINDFLMKMQDNLRCHNLYSVFYIGILNNSRYESQTGVDFMERMKGMGVSDIVNAAKKKGSTSAATEKGKAIAMKEKANDLHRSGKFEEAVEMYTKTLTAAYQETAARK